MNRETRRLILGSAAGIGAALAARYALTHPGNRRVPVRTRPVVKNQTQRTPSLSPKA